MYYPSAPAIVICILHYEYLIVMRAWPTEHWKLWKLLSNLDVTVQLRVTTPQTQSIPYPLNQRGRAIILEELQSVVNISLSLSGALQAFCDV